MKILRYKYSLLFLAAALLSISVFGQEERSRADILYYEYSFNQAVTEYLLEKKEAPLSHKQKLNLANAYLKTDRFKNAEETYLEVFDSDSTITAQHFNRMLRAISMASGSERAREYLKSRSYLFNPELLENAQFNFQLLESGDGGNLDFELFNVGSNSPQADFAPAFYKDRLLFTSGRIQKKKKTYYPSGEAFLDLYEALLADNGNILDPKPFTGKPASAYHQATPYYSEALDGLFYTKSNEDARGLTFDEKGKNALAIGMLDNNGTFRYLLRESSTSFYYPFFDEATGKLYFAAELEGGYGGTDLYSVFTNNGLIMSAPENLGPRINTPGNEIAPYIFENSLYFASDVFYGIGGMDIYKADMEDSGYFSIPINLGKEINTVSDEFGLIIRNYGESGLLGYFASNRPQGNGNDDIYGFKVAEKPGIKTFAVRGQVVNLKTKSGVPGAEVTLRDSTGVVLKELFTDGEGYYRVEVPWQKEVTIQATKDLYSIFTITYNEEEMETVKKGDLNLGIAYLDDYVKRQEGQAVIALDKFYFEKGRNRITPEVAAALDKVAEVVGWFPQLQLRIESHTDSRGGSSTNFRISQGRADAMKEYLVSKGVPSNNILYTVGYGEDRIINNCTSGKFCIDIMHKENERQLFVILNYNLLK